MCGEWSRSTVRGTTAGPDARMGRTATARAVAGSGDRAGRSAVMVARTPGRARSSSTARSKSSSLTSTGRTTSAGGASASGRTDPSSPAAPSMQATRRSSGRSARAPAIVARSWNDTDRGEVRARRRRRGRGSAPRCFLGGGEVAYDHRPQQVHVFDPPEEIGIDHGHVDRGDETREFGHVVTLRHFPSPDHGPKSLPRWVGPSPANYPDAQ